MTIAVRPATTTDLPALLTLLRQLHPGDPPVPTRTAAEIWTAIAAQQGRTVLIADVEGAVAGTVDCAVLPNLTRAGRAFMTVENVVVAEAHRRTGVGRRLLAVAAQIAESAGCYKIQLLSGEGRDMHSFYQACGFRPIAQGFRRYL